MTLKINILFVLSLLILTSNAFGEDKFLRIRGTVVDAESSTVLSSCKIRLVEPDNSQSNIPFDKGTFDFYVRDNRKYTVLFEKSGFQTLRVEVNTLSMPSFAYSKKHKLDLKIKLVKGAEEDPNTSSRVSMRITFAKNLNQFEVKDLTNSKFYRVPSDYEAPFESPADLYAKIKPTTKSLFLTTEYVEKKAIGDRGMSKALQGVLFADLNYCFFNERTNDGNKILEKLRGYNADVWGSINDIDSPEYGIIISRTINREQSVDTIFALGTFIETTRLMLQNFTSDSQVLTHLKKLVDVLEKFKAGGSSQEEGDFIVLLNELIPDITALESTFNEQLKNKVNFEMSEDSHFLAIKDRVNQIHLTIVQ